MDKVDLKKELKELYNPSAKEVSTVNVPDMNFLMIDGEGAPSSPQYAQSVEALFTVSYGLKFMVKKSKGIDYAVLPLEGLWWMGDMTKFEAENKSKWLWTSMIMQPKYVTEADVKAAIEQAREKKDLPAIDKVKFESYHEGLAAQIMYFGPFAQEGSTVAKIHDYIGKSGHELSGKHHEIYLNNPAKVAPEKLKTIIRQPMK